MAVVPGECWDIMPRQDNDCERMAEESNNEDRLIWIDLEMTGLDTDRDSIIEIATIVTDAQLNVLAEGPELAIAHSLSTLEGMDDWNRKQHGKSGLWNRILEDGVGMADAEARTLAFFAEWVPARMSPMCGNSICQDRRFLHRLMPRVEQYFHYRNLDVSTLKELARRWAPQVSNGMRKESAHTALSDVRDSIDELRYYRKHLAAFVGT
jgi:oligoribonuclease